MLVLTLQDLRFRARQFSIAVLGAGLVLGMTVLLTGLAAGFRAEIRNTVYGFGAQAWVLPAGTAGRVTSLTPLPSDLAVAVGHEPGVTRSAPVVVAPQAAVVGSRVEDIIAVGYVPRGLGQPVVGTGRAVQSDDEAVVDTSLGVGPGGHVVVSGRTLQVVGTVEGHTLLGGRPVVYVSLPTADAVAFGGQSLVSAVLVDGTPRALPPGLAAFSNSDITTRTLAEMDSAVSSIENARLLMWIVAAVIVAALVYVAALERSRDFAVLKALGSSSLALFGGLAAQAVLVSLGAAVLAAVLGRLMTGILDQPVEISAGTFAVLPAAAVGVGLAASLVALRRTVSVDPAHALVGG